MDINDVVDLIVDLPNDKLVKGMRGVIVMVLDKPELAYEVEFCNSKGETIIELAVKPEWVKKSE